jgi:hypothetical protein
MSAVANIVDFAFGEEVVIEFTAKDRDGGVYPDAATATCTMIIATGKRATSALVEVNGSPQVVLVNGSTADWVITLDHDTDLSALTPGQRYYFAIWTTDAGGDSQLQAEGDFMLPQTVRPS